jgi:adenylylsulfate kinase-like enzyme
MRFASWWHHHVYVEVALPSSLRLRMPLAHGCVVVLIGLPGAGKTTVARVLQLKLTELGVTGALRHGGARRRCSVRDLVLTAR